MAELRRGDHEPATLYASLMIGLFGIGLAGAAVIMQTVPEGWVRPVSAVAVGIAVLMTLTFFLTPHPKAASGLESSSPGPAGMTLGITPDHGRISTAFFVSGTGCPRPGGEIHVYFHGIDLFVRAGPCLIRGAAIATWRRCSGPLCGGVGLPVSD